MKEATGELNMTLVTISIITVIFAAITIIVPRVLNNTEDVWGQESKDTEVNFGKSENQNGH